MANEIPGLGDRVREVVTGKQGVVTGYCEYLWGCEQLLVYIDPPAFISGDKEPEQKTEWYDISRLALVERAAVHAIDYTADRVTTRADLAIDTMRPGALDRLFGRATRVRVPVFSGPDVSAPRR